MSFTNRFVTAEDKACVDFSSIKHPRYPRTRKGCFPHWWIIDQENNNFLFCHWSGREDDDMYHYGFVFRWNNICIGFILEKKFIGPNSFVWYLIEITYPAKNAIENTTQMFEALKQALLVNGDGGGPDGAYRLSVDVSFDF